MSIKFGVQATQSGVSWDDLLLDLGYNADDARILRERGVT